MDLSKQNLRNSLNNVSYVVIQMNLFCCDIFQTEDLRQLEQFSSTDRAGLVHVVLPNCQRNGVLGWKEGGKTH